MRPFRHHRFDLEQYFELEVAHPEQKYEFCDGGILAMSGGTLRHNEVASNVLVALRVRFPRCRVLGSDQRVATGDGLYTYPDVSVTCGKVETSRFRGTDTLHNPSLLVEVLSPSTRDYDLGEKLDRYQSVPALRDVLLVETDTPEVRHVRRTEEGWETRRFRGLDAVVDLAGATLPLAEIYAHATETE